MDVFGRDFVGALASGLQVKPKVVGCFLSEEGVVVVVFALGYFRFDVDVDGHYAFF